MVTPGFESYKLERQYCTGLKILEAQKNLFLNALNGTIKVIYFFENIFASRKRRITPCHPLLYPLSPSPTLQNCLLIFYVMVTNNFFFSRSDILVMSPF